MKTSIAEGDIAAPGWRAAWRWFWLEPVAPLGLHWVRMLSGLVFLAWLLPLTGQRDALFGLAGWFDRTAIVEAHRLPEATLPTLPASWSLVYLCGANSGALSVLWWSSIAVLVLFTLGIATRLTAVLTWVIVVSFQANPVLEYDADPLLAMLAFYLMLGYVFLGQYGELSVPERLLGPRGTSIFALLRGVPAPPSSAANLAVRLVQVHFALGVVVSGLHKLQFGDWWSGVAYWYPLHPPFDMDARKLAAEKVGFTTTLFYLSLAQYIALAWQLSFPAFAFRRAWRWLLLSGAAVAWVGIAFIYRLPLLGPVYAVCCLSYLSPQEWLGLTERLLSLVRRPNGSAAVDKKVRIKTNT